MKTTIKKYLEGKASREEMIGLIAWLDNEQNQTSFKEIRSEWKAKLDGQSVASYTLLELDKFKSKLLNERAGRIRKLNFTQNLYKYAAILLLLITIGSAYFYSSKSGEGPAIYNTIIAENGQISKALLPDSSVVWLNSGSSLKYSNRFGIGNRDIELSGQAYFDVAKNKDLPFVVSCGKINVKVLGTQFTAENYPDNLEVSVILIEGAVELTANSSNKTFASLQPNEMMVYNKQDNKFRISEVVAEKYTSWREGIIHIYDQPLKDAVTKLQKRYNQQIIVEKGLEDYKVTFSIRNENFKDVMDVLLAITPAKAYQEGEIIYLKKNK
jgi:ferric-dicitrate binding protein FerR (iron transport regulator)